MNKNLLFTCHLLLFAFIANGQNEDWTANTENRASIVADRAVTRQSYPDKFVLLNLNTTSFRERLFSVVGRNATRQSIVISLPNADGQLEQFEVFEASNFEPDLQERFPEIRAFSGKGITDKFATLKLSISPLGLQTMVFRTGTANEFIEPYSQDRQVYSVYRANRKKGELPWRCSTEETAMFNRINERVQASSATGGSTGQLKTMRLAQSCNGEYANYFGATSSAQVDLVLSAFNQTLTRCNGIYERDLALHLNLIANTTSVIYYNPATDPYSNTLSQWNLQLQQTLTAQIGNAGYDIGHMFGKSGGGGNAGCIGCVCVNPASNNSLAKGSGITSPSDGIPTGDNFDIDYVAHEVGHQLGGNHTFSHSSESTGQNKEVGSGITIMGYAGITNQDVAPHSIDIFHETTIAQIQANLATKSCPVSTSMTANSAPSLAALSNYTIPISTPFALTGSATDAEGDAITYNWEQNDNSTTTGTASVASPTKVTGPNWLSFPSTTSGTRLFPKLSTVLAGLNVTPPLPEGDAGANIEALSSVSRTLNFRLTVRDNCPYVVEQKIGQTAFADAVVTVTNTAGPFAVTYPNTNVTVPSGAATITWSVNGTNAGSVNCQFVNILLSTDGGNTFSTTLAASTPNDGTQVVTIPAVGGSTNRIKVESVGNIFYDISNSNFSIGSAPACGAPSGLTTSAITETSATLNWSAVSGATSYAVDFKPALSSTWSNVTTSTTGVSISISGLNPGTTYDWRVRATCTGGSGAYVQAQFITMTSSSTCPGPLDISSNGSIGGAADMSLNADVLGRIEVKNDVDHFRFMINTGGTITATLSTLPADYNLSILNSGGTVIYSSANGGTNGETINASLGAGTYYARVSPKNNKSFNASNCYTLRIATGSASRNSEVTASFDQQISVSPNPATYFINLSFEAKANGTGTVSIMNQTGAVVLRKSVAINEGVNRQRMQVSDLPNGLYLIQVQYGRRIQRAKLVVAK